MFSACTHGFISTTCPHCRGASPMDMNDEPGGPLVDMNRIMDVTVQRLERTGLGQNRREKAQIERSFR